MPLMICQYSKEYNEYSYAACLYPPIAVKEATNQILGKNEYIFLLDVSGSMRGERINLACEALTLFVRSLPVNSKFNIIPFSSGYKALFSQSKIYNEESMQEALDLIADKDKFQYGGTNLLNPLEDLTQNMSIDPNYPRVVFILTDGNI